MRELTDQQIDELVRQAQPRATAGGQDVDHPGLHRAEQDLLEEIMSTPARPQADAVDEHDEKGPSASPDHTVELGDVQDLPVRRPRMRMRAVAGIAAAAAVLAAVAVPALVFTGKDERHVEIKNPAAQESAKPGNGPLVLLKNPAWKISYVESSDRYGGTETFASGDKQLEVRSTPADQYQAVYDDRLDASPPQPISALGQTGAVFTYSSDDHAALFPPPAGATTFFEVRGNIDLSTFTALLAQLEIVPEGEWEAALPDSVVKPSQETQVAQDMLTGVPLPPGFDAAALPTGLANDYYQYGAHVTGVVTCGWLKEYRIARAADDEAGMAKVDAAMATSKNWTVLKTMAKQGAWPDVVWEYAGKVADRQPITAEEITQGLSCTG